MPAFSTLLNNAVVILSSSIRQEKEIRSIHIKKEEVKLYFADDQIICVKIQRGSTIKLPEP